MKPLNCIALAANFPSNYYATTYILFSVSRNARLLHCRWISLPAKDSLQEPNDSKTLIPQVARARACACCRRSPPSYHPCKSTLISNCAGTQLSECPNVSQTCSRGLKRSSLGASSVSGFDTDGTRSASVLLHTVPPRRARASPWLSLCSMCADGDGIASYLSD
jgi:hypothetical protein